MNDIDEAITAEVVRSALTVTVEEASVVVVRSSHSTNIQEGADAAGALLDARGQLVAQSTATSVLRSASLRCGLQSLLQEIPLSDMVPGDIFACNDAYRGGIHANDIMVLRPIFAEGELRWFAGTLIHVADMGGLAVAGLGSLTPDTYAEGVLRAGDDQLPGRPGAAVGETGRPLPDRDHGIQWRGDVGLPGRSPAYLHSRVRRRGGGDRRRVDRGTDRR